jgi:serine/threonine-protein kinase RsbW
MDNRRLSIELESDIARTEILYEAVTRFCRAVGLSKKLTSHVNIAAEELFTNIVKYAFDNIAGHKIKVTLTHTHQVTTLRMVDDGRPFDPTRSQTLEHPCPSLDGAKIGGLGIHLCKRLVDKMTYRREGKKNIVTVFFKSEASPLEPV